MHRRARFMKSKHFFLTGLILALTLSAAAQSSGEKSFDALKTLAGTWVGPVTTDPAVPGMGTGTRTRATLRVTSKGNALVHELQEVGKPLDPTKYDHPVTMFYLDKDQL